MASRIMVLLLVVVGYVLTGCQPAIERLPDPPSGMVSGPVELAQVSPQQPMLLEQRQLVLEWPKTIRVKDNDAITLSILMDQNGNLTPIPQVAGVSGDKPPANAPDLFATHNIMAVARLELTGVDAYHDEIREPLTPGRPVNFRWNIQANEAGLYRGVVWLRLELVAKDGSSIDEQLLLARPIEVQAENVFGLPGDLARMLGGAGLLVSAGLIYPRIHQKFAGRLERRASPQPLLQQGVSTEKEVQEAKEE